MRELQEQQACNSCKQTMIAQGNNLDAAIGGAISTSSAANATQGVASGISAGAAGVQQNNDQFAQQQQAKAAKNGSNAKAASAGSAASAFEQCANQTRSTCVNIGQMDQNSADQGTKACEDGANHSKKIAAEKAGTGNMMETLGQLAGLAGQAFQALQKGQQGTDPSSYNTPQTASNEYKPDTTQQNPTGSDLGGQDRVAGSALDILAGPGNTDIEGASRGANEIMAGGGTAASYSPDPKLDESLGGSDFSDMAAGNPAVANGASGAGGGFGGAGGGNMSGASTMRDKNKDGATSGNATGENFEVNMGGGGGGKGFLGLKGKVSDFSDLASAAAADQGIGNTSLSDLGLEEDGRQLASEDSDLGINAADGDSLFRAVHSKYAEIKKRGSI